MSIVVGTVMNLVELASLVECSSRNPALIDPQVYILTPCTFEILSQHIDHFFCNPGERMVLKMG
jgi:hypothetical protein